MHAGSIAFMRLSSQNETLNKQKRLLDGEASLEEKKTKSDWTKFSKKKRKKKKTQFNKYLIGQSQID